MKFVFQGAPDQILFRTRLDLHTDLGHAGDIFCSVMSESREGQGGCRCPAGTHAGREGPTADLQDCMKIHRQTQKDQAQTHKERDPVEK